MADIDHQPGCHADPGEFRRGRLDARRVIIGLNAAAQDDVAVLVAGGRRDRAAPALGHRHEMMRLGGRFHRLGGDAQIAVGAVLEADRAGQARCQLAMDLALGRARADRAPGDEVGNVLRRGHVEELGRRRQAEIVDGREHVARHPQPLVDVEAAVEVGIVDQALPADRGARLLEIDAHDDLEPVGQGLAQRRQTAGVVHGRDRIVDGTRADDDKQSIVGPRQDGVDGVARGGDGARRRQRARYLAHHLVRRAQFLDFGDPKIVCGGQHGFLLLV